MRSPPPTAMVALAHKPFQGATFATIDKTAATARWRCSRAAVDGSRIMQPRHDLFR
jgi:hypothetical protein